MQKFHVLTLAAITALAIPSIASAGTVTVATNIHNTDNGNFGTPDADASVGYTISVSDNGTSYIVVLTTTAAVAGEQGIVGDFANLYFDTTPGVSGSGSNLGFETTNYDAFIPGVSGSKDLTGLPGYSAIVTDSGGIDSITVTIPNTFFLDDPLGLGFTKVADGGEVSLHLSQSFSYSVAGGGANFAAPVELGEAVVNAASPVPEPASLTYMAMSGIGLLAEAGRRLRSRKRA